MIACPLRRLVGTKQLARSPRPARPQPKPVVIFVVAPAFAYQVRSAGPIALGR